MDYLNIAIAIAYFLIPLLLLPLLENADKDVKSALILAIAFVFSCGIGHYLEGIGYHHSQWHFVTAVVSWMAVAVLATSQSRLKMLAQSYRLLDISWKDSLVDKILLKKSAGDLEVLKVSENNSRSVNIRVGSMFSELALSQKKVFPQNKTVLDIYLNITKTEKMEFSYQDNDAKQWLSVVCVPFSKDVVYAASVNLSEWGKRLDEFNSDAYKISITLRQDIDNEFSLVYQPIVKIATGEIIGAEALLRWDSPELGKVSPDRFIPVAEANGDIAILSNWVLQTSFKQLAEWRELQENFSMSVNISPTELEGDEFLFNLLKLMSEFNVQKNSLGIEITERGIYNNLTRYLCVLKSLEDMNIRLKIDDFGTGQSGLFQLLQFSFKEVKLDKIFIPADKNDLAKISICGAIVSLSNNFGFSIIAEGVETKTQRDILIEWGIEYGQGYYFAKPMSAGDLTELLVDEVRLGE